MIPSKGRNAAGSRPVRLVVSAMCPVRLCLCTRKTHMAMVSRVSSASAATSIGTIESATSTPAATTEPAGSHPEAATEILGDVDGDGRHDVVPISKSPGRFPCPSLAHPVRRHGELLDFDPSPSYLTQTCPISRKVYQGGSRAHAETAQRVPDRQGGGGTSSGTSPATLRNWDRAGKLTPCRHPVNSYRLYRKEDLERILRQAEAMGGSTPREQISAPPRTGGARG